MIWRGEIKNSGTEIPFIVTVVPLSVVGRGSDGARVVAAAKFVPNMDPMPPPEILAENPAPSTTPLDGTDGAGAVVDAETSRTRPLKVSAMKRFPETSNTTLWALDIDAEVAGTPSPKPPPAIVVMTPLVEPDAPDVIVRLASVEVPL